MNTSEIVRETERLRENHAMYSIDCWHWKYAFCKSNWLDMENAKGIVYLNIEHAMEHVI